MCELPTYFERKHVAASSDAVIKLAIQAGAFAGVTALHGARFDYAPVQRWKGQLSKELVQRRIRKKLGVLHCVGFHRDVWDAVGIGLWRQGKF